MTNNTALEIMYTCASEKKFPTKSLFKAKGWSTDGYNLNKATKVCTSLHTLITASVNGYVSGGKDNDENRVKVDNLINQRIDELFECWNLSDVCNHEIVTLTHLMLEGIVKKGLKDGCKEVVSGTMIAKAVVNAVNAVNHCNYKLNADEVIKSADIDKAKKSREKKTYTKKEFDDIQKENERKQREYEARINNLGSMIAELQRQLAAKVA